MSTDIFAVLVGVIAAAVYIVCARNMAGMGGGRGGGAAGGGGRSAGGGGRGGMPAKAGGTPPAAKPAKANSGSAGKRSNWNADGTHGGNWDKGSAPKAGTQGSSGAPGKAKPAGSGKVTTVRNNAHGNTDTNKVGEASSAVADIVSNTAVAGNDNDGNNMVGGNFGDVPVSGTTSVSFDANGNMITDEQPGGK